MSTLKSNDSEACLQIFRLPIAPDRLPSSFPMDAAASEQTARPFPGNQQVADFYNLGT